MQHVTRIRTPALRQGAHVRHYRVENTFTVDSQQTAVSDDGRRTLRTRKHGNRNLPLPPIMDPLAINARDKHKLPKSREHDSLTPFQESLAANPFAQALATPVRQCVLTRARLPSHFLVRFVTSMPPRDTSDGERQRCMKPRLVPAVHPKAGSPSSYMIAHPDALESLSGRKGRWPRLVSERMRDAYALRAGKNPDSIKPAKEYAFDDEALEELRDIVRARQAGIPP